MNYGVSYNENQQRKCRGGGALVSSWTNGQVLGLGKMERDGGSLPWPCRGSVLFGLLSTAKRKSRKLSRGAGQNAKVWLHKWPVPKPNRKKLGGVRMLKWTLGIVVMVIAGFVLMIAFMQNPDNEFIGKLPLLFVFGGIGFTILYGIMDERGL